MGCAGSSEPPKEEARKAPEPPAGKTDVELKIGLNPRQAFMLKQSWKAVHRALPEVGVEMLVRLFKAYPEMKALFTKFKALKSEDEFRSSEDFENFAGSVMGTLDEAVGSIEDYDGVCDILKNAGKMHKSYPGFKAEHFQVGTWNKITDPFMDAMKITLGDRYSDNVETIYKVAITFFVKTLIEGAS